jgi:hypothetical protein
MKSNFNEQVRFFKIFVFSAVASLNISGCKMHNNLPRDEELQLFQPHRPEFICLIEAAQTPPIDAQADEWFREARAIEIDPELLEEERDYKKIVQLTRWAAERRHWKAIINLASLYLEGRDPLYGNDDAIALVEEAMRLGVPAAYDRMGTYHMNGVLAGGPTRAYAFWQKAADMGNPSAMTFLGSKLKATWDSPKDSFWSNIPVAMKMLECAFGQGDGEAALYLGYAYAPQGKATSEDKARAIRVLHDGTKLGCQLCAAKLSIEFEGRHIPEEALAPSRDKMRSERYMVLSEALRFNPSRRFPNLDKILPLPPASLPAWDGKRETLLKAAIGVTPFQRKPESSRIINGTGRAALDASFALQATGETINAHNAPFASYWRPTAPRESVEVQAYLAGLAPGLYARDEEFDMLQYPATASKYGTIRNVVWERMLTVPKDRNAVAPKAAAGLSREVVPPEPRLSCDATKPCPVTGTWQPWLSVESPLRHAINQTWRQAWITSGQQFPNPRQDWMLRVEPNDLSWHLLDSAADDIA